MVLKVFLKSNESSKYFAVLIGTKDEAVQIIEIEKRKNARNE
jgi:hypothetical protein